MILGLSSKWMSAVLKEDEELNQCRQSGRMKAITTILFMSSSDPSGILLPGKQYTSFECIYRFSFICRISSIIVYLMY